MTLATEQDVIEWFELRVKGMKDHGAKIVEGDEFFDLNDVENPKGILAYKDLEMLVYLGYIEERKLPRKWVWVLTQLGADRAIMAGV